MMMVHKLRTAITRACVSFEGEIMELRRRSVSLLVVLIFVLTAAFGLAACDGGSKDTTAQSGATAKQDAPVYSNTVETPVEPAAVP
jgi:hypothetical protein